MTDSDNTNPQGNLTPDRLREWIDNSKDGLALEIPVGAIVDFTDAWDRDRREIERLRAERDRLQKALERIDAITPVTCDMTTAHEMGGIAREALAAADSQVNPGEKRDG